MASNQIEKLKNRIFGKGGKGKRTGLTTILEVVREFSCLGEVIGRDYEIRNKAGELLYTVRQKPMAIKQLNTLIKELGVLKNLDNEREAAKWGKKGKR